MFAQTAEEDLSQRQIPPVLPPNRLFPVLRNKISPEGGSPVRVRAGPEEEKSATLKIYTAAKEIK